MPALASTSRRATGTSFTLPVPASYIIGQDRTVHYHFINADYTRRVEPVALLAELDRLAKAGAL